MTDHDQDDAPQAARPSSRRQGFDRPEYQTERDNHPYGGRAAERDRDHGHEAPVRDGASEGFGGGSPYYPPDPAGPAFETPDAAEPPTTRYGKNAPRDATPNDKAKP